ncbi:MAG: PAS domain S-box protein, partial [Planctomycetota bacterium]
MSSRTLRILLIEEDPLEACRIRESAGEPDGLRLEWTHATEWSEDRARLEGGDFDAILVDLDAPDAKGMNALLATMLAAPFVPVLALARAWNGIAAVEAIQAGAQDVLLKGEIRGDSFGRALLAAIERRKAEHAHESNEKLYRRIVESTDQGVCLADTDGRIVFANRKLGEMLGHAATEMTGKSLFDFMDLDIQFISVSKK